MVLDLLPIPDNVLLGQDKRGLLGTIVDKSTSVLTSMYFFPKSQRILTWASWVSPVICILVSVRGWFDDAFLFWFKFTT